MKTFFKIVIGSLVGCLLAAFVLAMLGISLIGSVASLTEKQAPSVSGNTILKLTFSTPVTEQAREQLNFSQFSGASFSENPSLYSIVRAIDNAALDPRISFIYMKPDMPALTPAQAEEIRAALVRFRESGKAVVSYSNQMTDGGYYLASMADKVLFNAYGEVFMAGMSTSVMFFKEAMDKLGIDVQLIRHGRYKAAGESFIQSEISPANREQNEEMVNSMWSETVRKIAFSRGFSEGEYNGWLDNLELTDAASLLERGLVDQLCYRDELEDYICSLAGADDAKGLKFIDVEDYAKLPGRTSRSRDKIAIVYCDGELVVEEGMQGTVAASSTAATLAEVRRDSTVKAVVLRVNSPGGSSLAAEMINRELGLLKEVKPVIASFGDYAASGGYWISARADKIFTDNATLTGSVGVFSIIPAFGRALRSKLGINVVSINSNRHSDILSMMDTFDEEETSYMLRNVEKVYADFTALVAEGRSMSVEVVDSLGQGRVWSGADAVRIGFADQRGGLRDAVLYAQTVAGLDDGEFRITEYPRVKSTVEKIMETVSTTGAGTSSGLSADPLGIIGNAYSYLRKTGKPQIYARMPYIYDFAR